MQSLALGTHLYSSLIRSTCPSQSMDVSSSLGCHGGSKMVIALYETLVGGDGGHKEFYTSYGRYIAKLQHFSLYPDVGGWSKRKGWTVSKCEISELWDQTVAESLTRVIGRFDIFWISRLPMSGTSSVPLASVCAALVCCRVRDLVPLSLTSVHSPFEVHRWSSVKCGFSCVMEELVFLWLCKA
jgi:hypothetical protein